MLSHCPSEVPPSEVLSHLPGAGWYMALLCVFVCLFVQVCTGIQHFKASSDFYSPYGILHFKASSDPYSPYGLSGNFTGYLTSRYSSFTPNRFS
jgi:hypothetical protein